MYCIACTKTLTAEEVYYYGDRCNECEGDELERYQRWLAGGEDSELNEVYTVTLE